MDICFAVLFYNPALVGGPPADYLSRVPLCRELPQRLAARGHRVDVVHAFPEDTDYSEGGVRYHFVASTRLARAAGRLGGRAFRRRRAEFEPAGRAIRRIVELEPQIVHFSSVTLHLNLTLLLHRLDPKTAVVIHHHGGEPAKRWIARRLQRRGLRRVSRLLVTARAHAARFVDAGALDEGQVVELMETSTSWRRRPRSEARRETGMTGDPVFLSAGRLHPVKDPLTLLRGFERIVREWPQARLYLYYVSGEMLGEMRAWAAARPALAGRVEFRGRVLAPRMEAVMNSADVLLQASRREWSGLAVLEAMACGTVPVVTDIPAFRVMTGDPDLLFPVGDADALARRVLALGRRGIAERSGAVRSRFEEHLSFAALAARSEEIYREILPPFES